jgi:hypothetical protein
VTGKNHRKLSFWHNPMRIGSSPRPIAHHVARYRFVWLLAALMVFFLLVPVLRELGDVFHPMILPLLELAIFLAILVTVVFSIGRKRSLSLVALSLGLPTAALWVIPATSLWDSIRVVRHVLAIALFIYAIASILRLIFASRTVTINLLSASLCAYLLIGVVCALTYSAMSVVNPRDFYSAVAKDTSPAAMQMDVGGSANAIYFSFVTLTTLGYGDIVPASDLTRRLAVVEAVIGQLYLAVLVARLVGLYTAEEGRRLNDGVSE